MITYTYHILAIYARHSKCTEFPDETSRRVTKITFYFLFKGDKTKCDKLSYSA